MMIDPAMQQYLALNQQRALGQQPSQQPMQADFAQPVPPQMDDVDFLIDQINKGNLAPGQAPFQPDQPAAPAPAQPASPVIEDPKKKGLSPQAIASLAAAAPQIGSQIGRLIDTLSDRRTKMNVRDDDIEFLLDQLGG